jgi:hypothetical protein
MIKTKLQDWAEWCSSSLVGWLPVEVLEENLPECDQIHIVHGGSQKYKKTLAKRTKGEYTVSVNQSSRIFSQKWPKFEYRVRIRITIPHSVLRTVNGFSSLKNRLKQFVVPANQPAMAMAESVGFEEQQPAAPVRKKKAARQWTQTAFWPEAAGSAASPITVRLRKPKPQQLDRLGERSAVPTEANARNIWRRLRHRIGTCDSTCARCKHKWAVIELRPQMEGKRVRAFRAYA